LFKSVKERFGVEVRAGKYWVGIGVACGGDVGGVDEGSFLNSILISLPCLELGGGGFFLPCIDDSDNTLRSSSGSDISCEVRGDSGSGSCTGSNIDCRDREDVSVLLLPPSPDMRCMG
jgi:hypothetical protein